MFFVELYAEQAARVARNGSEFRLSRKRSHRDRAASHDILMSLDARYVMNTGEVPTLAEDLLDGRPLLRIDNTHVPAPEVAARIVSSFGLPTDRPAEPD